MAKFVITHEIKCNKEQFWKLFWDKAFIEKMYREELGYRAYEIREQSETERKVDLAPNWSLPGPMRSRFSLSEEGELTRGSGIWRWRATPSILADKIRLDGTMRLEPISSTSVRRIGDLQVEATVPIVDLLLESSFETRLRAEWSRTASYMSKHLSMK
ncbi:DUF2505 domain-containing protein [Pendulispora brunnea]|uniref:DUF2505 domain-containing protein n=1 Tax=Pendulispora brunnea TaxID=2905690 RepID=A0ABZ2KBT7_9BACT